MKNKIAISIILTLLMVVSTFSVATGTTTEVCSVPEDPEPGEIEVVKQVWNGSAWTDEYEAEVGENVSFKITITYHKTCGFKAININVTDSLDPIGDLSYTIDPDSFNVDPTELGQPIVWNLTDELYDNESLELLFNVTITAGPGELVNAVSVEALERCCGKKLYGEDQVTVTVECEPPCIPGIEVNKLVYNETTEEWVEFLDDITIGELVKFKVEILFTDCGSGYELLNMVIRDMLPCCLIFNETLDIYTDGEADDPTEEVSNDGKLVFWNWTFDRHIVLHDGEKLTVEFLAEFVNYCETIGENWADVEAWGCSGPKYVGRDKASVDCNPPETTFEKKAYNGSELVDEINTTVGEMIRFRIELNYYGAEPLYDINIYDELPCILLYANELDSNVENITDYVNISEDLKNIWWNLSHLTLLDGEVIWIEFDAEVVGTTECSCGDQIVAENFAYIDGRIGCAPEPDFYDEDRVIIHASGNCPPSRPSIRGPQTGVEGEELTFYFLSSDSDGDQIRYNILWNDGTGVLETTYYNSNEEVQKDHTFNNPGTYKIKAEAIDEHGASHGYTPVGFEFIVVITPEEEPPEAHLDIISPKMFNMKTITTSIINDGDIDLTDVEWEFKITKTGLLGGFEVNTSGTISSLEVDQTSDVTSGQIKLKFGMATVEINAKSGVAEDTYSAKAILLGSIILIL